MGHKVIILHVDKSRHKRVTLIYFVLYAKIFDNDISPEHNVHTCVEIVPLDEIVSITTQCYLWLMVKYTSLHLLPRSTRVLVIMLDHTFI